MEGRPRSDLPMPAAPVQDAPRGNTSCSRQAENSGFPHVLQSHGIKRPQGGQIYPEDAPVSLDTHRRWPYIPFPGTRQVPPRSNSPVPWKSGITLNPDVQLEKSRARDSWHDAPESLNNGSRSERNTRKSKTYF